MLIICLMVISADYQRVRMRFSSKFKDPDTPEERRKKTSETKVIRS